ncbi:MAG: hypothetical protein JWM16_3065 [Verrucomicrobiales bacterium]|nr:hypothetical protein [Verrucomicrobiales bacterium]
MEKFRSIAYILIPLVAVFAGYLLGRGTQPKCIKYSVYGQKAIVLPDVPVYGLPMVEYATLLNGWRSGLSDVTLGKAEAFLDLALEDACQRRRVLSKSQREFLDRSICKVARYRERFPRPLSAATNQSPSEQSAHWTREREQEIDTFLSKVLEESGKYR